VPQGQHPEELNHYKEFLRGQNHYDTYLLSGVSGHGARSFYYPDKAKKNCAECHMPFQTSTDFGAKFLILQTRTSQGSRPSVSGSQHRHRVHPRPTGDRKAARELFERYRCASICSRCGKAGRFDGKLIAPLRPQVPVLKPGATYLVEAVLRTLKLGHPLTQGTADSNELWVDAKVVSGDRTIGRSGGLGEGNAVDPWSHFVNVYMLDREGRRIDRRNPQDIFTPLYNHQIPPGAAQVSALQFPGFRRISASRSRSK
jgi:hypothetical protein